MNTPIADFVRQYRDGGTVRFHMPGHKGQKLLGPEELDITEVKGADALFEAGGVIRESEENASRLFGSLSTFYSTEGSSLSIRAMLYLVALYAREKTPGKKEVRILASRNVHKSFLYACALLDLSVSWLPGANGASFLSARTEKELFRKTLSAMETLPDAVFLTSPDYLGNLADIAGFSDVLKKYDIPLLVDNAHGAYLHFLKDPMHPLDLGADLVSDSAHKTLPALTGAAYLHIAKDPVHPERAAFFRENAKRAMALFGSTSPSYLILQSLDLVNACLQEGFPERLNAFAEKLDTLKEELRSFGYTLYGDEALKLTFLPRPMGYSGQELAELLRKKNIECEYADRDALVLMLSPGNTDEELALLKETLLGIPKKEPLPEEKIVIPEAERVMSIREAFFSSREVIPAENAAGRIAASPLVSCPPAIPIVVAGERITEDSVRLLRHYETDTVEVIKTLDKA